MGQEITREDLQEIDPPQDPPKEAKPPFNPGLQGGTKEEPTKEPPKEEPGEYVYPDDPSVPEPLRGKKASEAVGVFNTLQTLSQGVVKQLKMMQEATAKQPKELDKPIFDKDEFINSEPNVIEEKMATLFEKKATPFMVDVYAGLSSMAMNQAETSLPYFKRFKAEILSEASNQPVNRTARFDTWKDIHDRVAARHVNEIAAEINKPKPPPPIVERGGGTASVGNSDDLELDADDKKIADGIGVDYATFKKYKKFYVSAD